MDDSLVTVYIIASLGVWIDLRIQLLSTLVTLAIGVYASQSSNLSPELSSTIGLALIYSTSLSGLIFNALWSSGELEQQMNAVERLDHYSCGIPQEAARFLPSDPPADEWPTKGRLEIQNLEIRYPSRPDFAVIQGLSVSIPAGTKVGVVGRTGSGKSTLASALFRLMEASKGCIKIDGQGKDNAYQDISQIGLDTLRKQVQMIPQEPVLFDGTFRSNLDFQSQFSDDEIWDALQQSGLHEYVTNQSEKLNARITASGDNLSVGQRQLVCLARAILQKPRVIVLDEATANIDSTSDHLIQRAIKETFSQATVVSIAHRLNTVADFDKILVLDGGKLVEFDTPTALLRDTTSLFAQMANASGPGNFEHILKLATEKSKSK